MESILKRRRSNEVQELMNAVKNEYEFFTKLDNSQMAGAVPAKRPRSLKNEYEFFTKFDNSQMAGAVPAKRPRSLKNEYEFFTKCDNSQMEGAVPAKRSRSLSENVLAQRALLTPRASYPYKRDAILHFKKYNQSNTCVFHENYRQEQKYFTAQGQKYLTPPELKTPLSILQRFTAPRGQLQMPRDGVQITEDKKNLTMSREQNQRSRVHSETSTTPLEDLSSKGRQSTKDEMVKQQQPLIQSREHSPIKDFPRRSVIRQHSYEEVQSMEHAMSNKERYSLPMRRKFTGHFHHPQDNRFTNINQLPTMIKMPERIHPFRSSADEMNTSPIHLEKEKSSITKTINKREETVDKIVPVNVRSSDCDKPPLFCKSQSSEQNTPILANQKAKMVNITEVNHEVTKAEETKQGMVEIPQQLSVDHVVTRVNSLLWINKDIVYPVTLHEMRRRLQDPENFSFQMLIAYVRHSRAKGRQFLDYWNCKPSDKSARATVFSKLCEADARELVTGIRKVNEEYFPRNTLAKILAKNVLAENNMLNENKKLAENETKIVPYGGRASKEKNVDAIEKTRNIFKLLRKTVSVLQDEERFQLFNVASHNAGVANILNSLEFLESIFHMVQKNIQTEAIKEIVS